MNNLFDNCSPIPCSYHAVNSLGIENSVYPKRIVEHLEIELVEDGTGEIMVDDEKLCTSPHSLHFRCPGMVVQGKGKYKSRYISFDFNIDNKGYENLMNLPKYTILNDFEKISLLFDTLFEDHYKNNDMQQLRFKIAILSIFEKIMVQSQQTNTNERDNRIEIAIKHIQGNFVEKISVEKLAKISGYSEFHFIRKFKNYTSQNPTEYITLHRLNYAKKLLVETESDMDSIAEKSGFNSYSYFFRIFKKKYLISPYKYRNSHRK